MKINKKTKLFLSSIAGVVIFASPIFSLISCENKNSNSKISVETLKSKVEDLKKKIHEWQQKDNNAINEKSFVEAQNLIAEIEKNIKNKDLKEEKIKNFDKQIDEYKKNIDKNINNLDNIDHNTGKPKADKNLDYSDKQFEEDIKQIAPLSELEEHFIFSFDLSGNNKKSIYPSQLQRNISSLILKFKKDDLNAKIELNVDNVILEDNANMTGNAKFNIVLRNRATNTTKNLNILLSGLANNPANQDSEGNYPNYKQGNNSNINQNETSKYIAMDQNKRFEYDNSNYMQGLKQYLQLSGINSINDLRPSLNATEEQKKIFNDLAATVNQDSYDNAAYKGFSLVSYKSNGQIDGIEIKDGPEMGKQGSWVDKLGQKDPNKINGLARMILNDHYLRMAMQTFSISFSNFKDFKEDISKLQKTIEYWKDPNNKNEYDKLVAQKIKDLEKNKEEVRAEWDDRIHNNKDVHLIEGLKKQKQEALEEYDKAIADYRSRSPQDEIKLLEAQIKDFKKRAQSKKEMTTESGTMWILDYQIDDSKKSDSNWYPTKWYFGTNSHVAKAITNNLNGFSITKLRSDIKVGQKLRISQMDDNIVNYNFNDTGAIRKVFDGIDYLQTSPSMYLTEKQKNELSDVEEFADFAVLEIDFSKIKDYSALSNDLLVNEFDKNDFNFANKIAKTITNDYANEENKLNHIKFRKKSYLTDYKAIDFPLKGNINDLDLLYILGWPSSKEDYYLEKYIDDDQRNREFQSGGNFSLWTNSQSKYYGIKINDGSYSKEQLDRGDWLSYQLGYRTFTNMPGIIDTFIGVPKLGKDFYYVDGKRYVNMALAYSPRRYAPIGGASGSSVRNQNNELMAVYYGSNKFINAGLAVALRSEGFDYKGLYGRYNLPQYDLIYGGGREQKNSYRQALKNLYESQNIKTNLFNQGLEEEFVPEDFKF
ncbi:hypothetical protein DMC14_000790 [Metamycoplasma phocicerebrale]|uniref:DUF31 domain-containing protein n=1 Tax=Metamycoplasma phocicerebrale TaxID=142649 RepID=A0A3T0TTM8_9BACT|nr:DUF31 family protein [Metamycoplasma phocicerebrale]AZZ65329.1 hypothetical protein DMC14_000790 [Metamycoplasma phocicerebrale]